MEERPVAFASRTLSSVERNYAQVEKEALVCVIAVEKFHLYISSQSFTLLTDHKPLVTLFGENKPISPQASARLQRWALTLAIYNYRIAFKAVHSEWLASCSGTPVETLLVTSIRTDSARWMHCLGGLGWSSQLLGDSVCYKNSRLHLDFAGPMLNHMFLVVVDAHTKWIEVVPMSNSTSFSTIQQL